jgi:hypothetical protein
MGVVISHPTPPNLVESPRRVSCCALPPGEHANLPPSLPLSLPHSRSQIGGIMGGSRGSVCVWGGGGASQLAFLLRFIRSCFSSVNVGC